MNEIKFETMTDMELQKRCIEAGHQWVEKMYPGLRERDIERASQIANAVAAGYSKGWSDRGEQDDRR